MFFRLFLAGVGAYGRDERLACIKRRWMLDLYRIDDHGGSLLLRHLTPDPLE
jgi:hypothetical protein